MNKNGTLSDYVWRVVDEHFRHRTESDTDHPHRDDVEDDGLENDGIEDGDVEDDDVEDEDDQDHEMEGEDDESNAQHERDRLNDESLEQVTDTARNTTIGERSQEVSTGSKETMGPCGKGKEGIRSPKSAPGNLSHARGSDVHIAEQPGDEAAPSAAHRVPRPLVCSVLYKLY